MLLISPTQKTFAVELRTAFPGKLSPKWGKDPSASKGQHDLWLCLEYSTPDAYQLEKVNEARGEAASRGANVWRQRLKLSRVPEKESLD